MDFAFTAHQQATKELCERFAEKEIAPHMEALEEDLAMRRSLFKKMAAAGLFSLVLPTTQPLDSIAYFSGLKAIAKVDAGVAVTMSVTNMVVEAINTFGSPSQKEKYLTAIQAGLCVPLSFAVTEPQAGSDVKAIKTQIVAALHDAHHLVLSGKKQFITNANLAGALIVIVKEATGAISAVLMDGGVPGMEIVKKERKLGLLTADLVDISFNNCLIPKSALFGKSGEGLKIALGCLDSGRIGIAAQAIGIAEAAYEAALEYAKNRLQFGRPIFENQAIAFKLADMHVKISAANQMLYKAAWLKDLGQPFTVEAAEAKLFCSEVCNQVADEALQIHGGYGYVKGYLAEKYFRDARSTTIYEGTSEIQRLVIARNLSSRL